MVSVSHIIPFTPDVKANPCVRFNKEGTLLAVSANDNKIKILAKDGSLQSLHTTENCLDDDFRVFSDTLKKVGIFNTVMTSDRIWISF